MTWGLFRASMGIEPLCRQHSGGEVSLQLCWGNEGALSICGRARFIIVYPLHVISLIIRNVTGPVSALQDRAVSWACVETCYASAAPLTSLRYVHLVQGALLHGEAQLQVHVQVVACRCGAYRKVALTM